MRVGIERLTLHPTQRGSELPRPSPALLALTRRHGPIQPVVTRRQPDARFEILLGADTWLAAQSCGHHDVPIEVLDDIDDAEALEIVSSAKSRGPLDTARRYARLVEEEKTLEARGAIGRTAAHCGVSRTQLTHALRLLRLPDAIQAALSAGKLSVGHGRALLACPDPHRQQRLADRIVSEQLSVRATEQAVRGELPDADNAAPAAPRSPDVARLERRLTETIGSPVTLDEVHGRLTIDYGGSNDVLGGILDRFGLAGD